MWHGSDCGGEQNYKVPTRFELMLVESKPTVITNYTMGPPIFGSTPGIEPGTSSTLKTNHTPRPSGHATSLKYYNITTVFKTGFTYLFSLLQDSKHWSCFMTLLLLLFFMSCLPSLSWCRLSTFISSFCCLSSISILGVLFPGYLQPERCRQHRFFYFLITQNTIPLVSQKLLLSHSDIIMEPFIIHHHKFRRNTHQYSPYCYCLLLLHLHHLAKGGHQSPRH